MNGTGLDCAEAFAQALFALAEQEPRIRVVLNDSTDTNHLEPFVERYPDRVIDVGIAEQNMVGVSAGLANAGFIPVVHSASCFLTARALEQIKNDVAYNNLNVKLCGFVAGLAYGPCGGTHHAVEDIAWTRAIPNLAVIAPATPVESVAALRAELQICRPAFLRIISKILVPELFPADHIYAPSTLLRDGADVALIGVGVMTSRLVEVADLLLDAGIRASVLNVSSISPPDRDAIVGLARRCGRVVVAEEHVVNGGLGGTISEILAEEYPTPALLIGIPNVFAPIGTHQVLHEYFGLTAARITNRVKDWVASGPHTRTRTSP